MNDYSVELFQAYRRGLMHHQAFAPKELNFSNLIAQGLITWPTTLQRKFLKISVAHSYDGLLAARRGDREAAEAFFERSQAELDRLEGPFELLALALHEAAIAYLDHRQGRHAQARLRVARVLDADLALEQDHDLSVMLMHRVQQGHNLARVDLRQGRRHQAMRLAGLLVAYLEGHVDELPFHREWSPKTRRTLSGYLVRGMISQIAGETVGFITTGDAVDAEWAIFLEAAAPRPPGRETRFVQVQHALCARAAQVRHDRRAWYEHLREFFEQGPTFNPTLFYAMAVDFARACRTGEEPWGVQVAEAMERDSAKWRGCHPQVRQSLLSPPQGDVRTVA